MNLPQNPHDRNIPEHIAPDRVFDFNIYGDERLTEDLHTSYATLHRDAPDIFWTPANGGHWMVLRFADIADIVRDPEHFSAKEMHIPRVPDPPLLIPLTMDPPDNIPYRQALNPFFSPRASAALEPRIREFAVDIIESVRARGECDFVHEVSARFPVSVFMELMGMPLDKLHEFRSRADDFFNSRSPEALEKASAQIVGIMTELIEMRMKNPGDDLISHMTQFKINGRDITLGEMQSACFLLFLGGMDTVSNVTSYLYRHLAGDPALQARIRNDPSCIPQLVEEGLRSFGVVNTPRIVARDCEKFGVKFKTGDMVLCCLPMGGRDERVNENPNQFDIDRKAIQLITFSTGIHLCLGHHLARVEFRVFAEEWFSRIPEFRAKPGVPQRSRYGTVMALESLQIQWNPAA